MISSESSPRICEHYQEGVCLAEPDLTCRPGTKRCRLAQILKATTALYEQKKRHPDVERLVVERWLYSDYDTLEKETGLRREEIAEVARKHYDEIFRDGLGPFPERVACRICGKELREITSTHLRTHSVSLAEYVAQFGHVPKQIWDSRYREYRRWLQDRPLSVVKRDGRTEPFAREKIVGGLEKALGKKGAHRELIQTIADDIERTLRMKEVREVSVQRVGEMILDMLKRADMMAYLRFASVFRDLHTAQEFLKEAREFLGAEFVEEGRA